MVNFFQKDDSQELNIVMYMTKFLTLSEIILLGSTCKLMHSVMVDEWMHRHKLYINKFRKEQSQIKKDMEKLNVDDKSSTPVRGISFNLYQLKRKHVRLSTLIKYYTYNVISFILCTQKEVRYKYFKRIYYNQCSLIPKVIGSILEKKYIRRTKRCTRCTTCEEECYVNTTCIKCNINDMYNQYTLFKFKNGKHKLKVKDEHLVKYVEFNCFHLLKSSLKCSKFSKESLLGIYFQSSIQTNRIKINNLIFNTLSSDGIPINLESDEFKESKIVEDGYNSLHHIIIYDKYILLERLLDRVIICNHKLINRVKYNSSIAVIDLLCNKYGYNINELIINTKYTWSVFYNSTTVNGFDKRLTILQKRNMLNVNEVSMLHIMRTLDQVLDPIALSHVLTKFNITFETMKTVNELECTTLDPTYLSSRDITSFNSRCSDYYSKLRLIANMSGTVPFSIINSITSSEGRNSMLVMSINNLHHNLTTFLITNYYLDGKLMIPYIWPNGNNSVIGLKLAIIIKVPHLSILFDYTDEDLRYIAINYISNTCDMIYYIDRLIKVNPTLWTLINFEINQN